MGIPCAVRHFFWLRKWLNYWRGLLFFRLMWYHQSDWETEKTRQLCNYYILHTNSNIKIACLISQLSSLFLSITQTFVLFRLNVPGDFHPRRTKTNLLLPINFAENINSFYGHYQLNGIAFRWVGKIMVFLFLALFVAVHLWNNSRGVHIRNHHLSKYMHWNENIYV